MTGAPSVVLDACVLANFSLCDTLLRLAEPPRLFEPKWSEEIIRETTRTLELKLGWHRSLTAHLEAELRGHFSEAWISGYESLVPRMTNDEEDRHVVAAGREGRGADHRDSQPSPLQTRASGAVGYSRHAPSDLPDRDLPTGTSAGDGETGTAGSRPKPQPAPTSRDFECNGTRVRDAGFRARSGRARNLAPKPVLPGPWFLR